MAQVDVVVKSTDQGSRNIQTFGDRLAKLGMQAFGISSGLGAAQAALGAVANAAKVAWQVLNEGAALELAESRFENLAASIGTTADALRGDLADATQGMMSNAQMVASASDLISLGLADTGDEVVRLANLVGQLGWDMQVLTLTMANDSMLRLDSLGLSMADVKQRMNELKAAGVAADEAFDLAVIEAGEAKLELLGSSAESTAGRIKQLTAVWANARDEFSKAFAVGVADEFAAIAGSVTAAGTAIELAASGAGGALAKIASSKIFTDPTFQWLIRQGMKFAEANRAAEQSAQALAMSEDGLAMWGQALQDAQIRGEEFSKMFDGVAITAEGLDWALRNNAYVIEDLRGQFAGLAVDTEIYGDSADMAKAKAMQFAEALGVNIAFSEDAAEASRKAAEEQAEAAAVIAEAYEEAGRRMGQAFAGFVNNPETMPDFGNIDSMNEMAWDMASAFGLTAIQAGNVGIALGQITPEMAEAAAKAVIFQEAFGNLLGQLSAGNLDTSGFMAAYDALIADMQSKSLVEIQVELKQKANPARELWAWLPAEERVKEVEVPVTFTPEEAALQQALGMIDGIPDEQTKVITFDPVYDEVTTAVDTIEADIGGIDGTVLFSPQADEVYNVINRLDQSHITVYVDYVNNGDPELPEEGRAMGGSVVGGRSYWVGERGMEKFVPWTDGRIVPNHELGGGGAVQVTIQQNFYGPTNGGDVAKAGAAAGRRLMELLRQSGMPT